jgi:predicted HTH transcriptional regulator
MIKSDMAALQQKGLLKREGAKKSGMWIVISDK